MRLLAMLDKVTGMAEPDQEMLRHLFAEIGAPDDELLNMVWPELGDVNDPDEQWKGMPEYEQENAMGFHHLIVHFDTEEDLKSFARLIKQKLTNNTRSIWHPFKQPLKWAEYQTVDES